MFIRYFAVSASLIIGFSAAMGFIVNPHSRYNHRFFKPLASDSHREKYFLLDKMAISPQVFILGSSRSMTIDPAVIQRCTGLAAFNAAVNGARAEDMLAIARYIINKKRLTPELFIIGLDVMAFQLGGETSSGLTGFKPLSSLVERESALASIKKAWGTFASLFSLKQTIDAVKVLALEWIVGWPGGKAHYRSDGMLIYRADVEADTVSLPSKIEETSRLYIGKVYNRFPALDVERLGCFKNLLNLCVGNGIQTYIFITPFHPRTLKALTNHGVYPLRKQELIDTLMQWRGILPFFFSDMSDIQSFHGIPEAFYDGEHMRKENADRLIKQMLSYNTTPQHM